MAATALGQQTTGTIVATVVDAAGAVVPEANAIITLVTTNAKRIATSNQNGELNFQALVPGTYKLELFRQGFKSLSIDRIELQSSETRDMGKMTLQVGSVNESVEVTAEATPVQSASSDKADSVSKAQIDNISMKGRDPWGQLKLIPGVIDTSSTRDGTSGNIANISLNGMSGGQIQAAVDGAPNQQQGGTSNLIITPNLDAIEEIRVQSSGSQAEFGRDAGGTINFVTKSGTSKFHGTFHWDHRNEGLNANSYFNNRASIQRPVYRYLILGGSLGGPLYIPKVMPKSLQGKLFFFYSPEYSTSKQPTDTQTVNLPTELERSGNFSQTFFAQNSAPTVPLLVTIKDPNTGLPFPNNVIPGNRISALGLGMLNLLQKPNGYRNPALPYTANASYSATPTAVRVDQVFRVDANVSKNLTMYFRLVRDIVNTGTVNSVTAGLGNYIQNTPGSSYLGHAAWIITPTLVNESQFIYTLFHQGSVGHVSPDETALYHSTALDPPRLVPYPVGKTVPWGYNQYPPYLPRMSFSGGNYTGYASFDTNARQVQYEYGYRQYIWRDDLTWVHGSHRIKGGVYWEYMKEYDEHFGSQFDGNYNFGSTSTNPLDTGNGYANALLGIVTTYTESSARPLAIYPFTDVDWYVQDNWKVNHSFTLDYGMRFFHAGATQDQTGFLAHFLPSAYNPAMAARLFVPDCKVAGATCSPANQFARDPLNSAITGPSSAIAQIIPGSGSPVNGVQYPVPYGLHYAPVQYQPRFGFAWNIRGDGKTVIRGSFAVMINRPSNNNAVGQYFAPANYTNVASATLLSSIGSQGSPLYVTPVTGAVNAAIPMERAHNWNLTFERAVGFSTVLNIAYIGTYDRHQQMTITRNNVQFGAYALAKNVFNNAGINANLLRTEYPGMGVINTYCGCSNSVNYNGLQVSVKHRFTKGLTFNGNYQFSKALATGSSNDPYHTGTPIQTAYGGTITFPGQRDWYYGPTSSDRSQYGGANFAYELPKPRVGKLANYFVAGWTLSGVTSFSTGAPISPTCTSSAPFPANDPTWTGAGGIRCQVVGDWKNFTQRFDTNFNKAAFAFPNGGTAANPTPTFGNAGLGIMRQPGWWNQDLTIAKVFRVGEARTLGINFQTYNVFNHAQFNAIGSTSAFNAAGLNTNQTTGQYTATAPPRQVAISARFQF
ncbi:MAG: TonB-dependent receptor [Candidatus Solibacter sp.]